MIFRGKFQIRMVVLLALPAFGAAAAANDPFGLNANEIIAEPYAAVVAADAHVGWHRVTAWWKWVEPNRGQFDWSSLDTHIATSKAQGLDVLLRFQSIPSWANGSATNCDFWAGECSGPLTDAAYFAEFATAVANRYGNDITYYEVWNEPDWPTFWTGTLTQWVDQILIPGSQAIRTADPGAQIVGPATTTNQKFQTFVDQSCPYLDVLSTHYYTADALQMLTKADNLKWYIETNCNKPLWVTEFGIDSWVTGEKQQAKDYVDAFAGVVARPFLAKLFLFMWRDGDPAGGGKGFGLVDREVNDFRRKRSFFEVRDYIAARLGYGGAPLIRDTFATVAASRPDGSLLNGSATEVGGLVWSASSTAVVRGSALAPSTASATTQRGGVPFDPASHPSDPVSTVEADVVMNGAQHISIGFSLSATGSYPTYGQVWAKLRNDGQFRVYYNGGAALATVAPAAGFDANGLNTIRLQYDAARNRVSAWINGSTVVANADLVALGFQPVIHYTGFQMVGDGTGTPGRLIDNYQVEVGGSAVAAPVISQHPTPLTIVQGGTGQFAVAATGEGTLSYRWQRNGLNLAEGGHYSGTTSPTLTVSGADSTVAGNFRVVVSNTGGSTTSSSAALTVQTGSSCTPSATTLCLSGGRFAAQISFEGVSGNAAAFSDLAGFYYKNNSANVEAAVKVLDGRAVNGKFWVFHGSLTSLGYVVTVTDTSTGAVKTYTKPAGSYCGDADTTFFGDTSASSVSEDGLVEVRHGGLGTCTPTSTSVCLLGSRFQVQVQKNGVGQAATAVTELTGAFSFGNLANPDVVVKVLDGTPVNGQYWVFFGSLTNQGYQVVVTDTSNGAGRTYSSPAAFCGSADTAAF